MRKIIFAAAIALPLAACGGGIPTGVTTAITGVSNTISTIQAGAVKACAFKATEATIESLISVFVPSLDSIQSIINQICSAVTVASTPSARLARVMPMVHGVPIRGRFVSH